MQYTKGELRFECDFDPMCGQEFASRDDLDRHEREEHWANLPDPDGSNELPVPDGPWFQGDD